MNKFAEYLDITEISGMTDKAKELKRQRNQIAFSANPKLVTRTRNEEKVLHNRLQVSEPKKQKLSLQQPMNNTLHQTFSRFTPIVPKPCTSETRNMHGVLLNRRQSSYEETGEEEMIIADSLTMNSEDSNDGFAELQNKLGR